MGIGNSIKQEEARKQAQPQANTQASTEAHEQANEGADIIGLLKDVQAALNETREASAADRKAMQSTLDEVATTAAEMAKVQSAITANTDKVAASTQEAIAEFNKGLADVAEQVKAVRVSQNELGQAVTLRQVVREIEAEFEQSTTETVQAVGADLDEQLATVQERFRSPVQWLGHVDLKELFSKAAQLYLWLLAALITAIATVLLVVIGTRQVLLWATTTPWVQVVIGLLLVAPAVLSILALTRWLWQRVKGE